MSTRIVIVDDHGIMREGLRSLIEKLPGMTVVADAENGRLAVELVERHKPDILILDVSMPELNGIEAARRIRADGSSTRIIALSMHADRRFVGEMLKAGASGYLLKDCVFEELHQAIQSVLSGEVYLSPRIAGVVVKDLLQTPNGADKSTYSLLSSREREVLQMFAEGKTTKQIAMKLHLSVKTIETHRQNIMKKLKIDNVAELTKYAIREGLTTLEE